MGLFENPDVSPKDAKKFVRSAEHREVAREVAREGVVLLKNDGILPLSKDVKSIAVIGPNADTQYNQLGDYTAPQDDKFIITPLEGIQAAVSKNTKVTYVKGCAIRDVTMSNIPAAVEAAKASDVVVLVVGGSSARDFKTKYIATGAATVSNEKDQVLIDMDCGEGYDRSTLDLLGDQEKLMQALIETGKPLVVVYIQGRTLKMNLAAEKANALLTAWYPGGEGGHGIADVLFGDYNPAGRLPVSIPRNEGQLPIYYSKGKQRDYMDGDANALYAFGYGLSYTKFEYSDLQIKPGNGKDVLQTVTCTVKNTGNCDGQEIVQLYIRDMVASVAQAPILLKAFERITLKKGESKTVTFNLGKKELSIYNMNLEEVVEPGEFKVMVGAASNDIRLNGKFEL
jgi:beta-glucosidase